jgi:hypothetical protein
MFNLNSFTVQASDYYMGVSPDKLESMVKRNGNNLRMFFAGVNLSQLKESDQGQAIKNGFEDAKTQMTSLQSIFNGLGGNNDADVREYVYNQLLKVDDYQKASGFMEKVALKTVFNKYSEPKGSLKSKVKELREKFE